MDIEKCINLVHGQNCWCDSCYAYVTFSAEQSTVYPKKWKNVLIYNVISIVQLNVEGKVVGFLSIKDYPLQPSVLPGEWEEYIWNTFKALEFNSRNTLFIHMFCWKNVKGSRKIVDNMLESVFMHDPYVHYIAVLKFFPKHEGNLVDQVSFRSIQAVLKDGSFPKLWIADRSKVCPRKRIRRAVEEDNDDLAPILDVYSPRLKQMYGEYYISELVAYPESRCLLVCEHKEEAIGVMCFNTEINYETLEESFDLLPMAGLKHLSTKLIIEAEKSKMMETVEKSAAASKVTVSSHSRSRFFDESTHALVNEGDDSTYSSSTLVFYDVFPEDDIEYDILNIDEELLKVPRQISSSGLYNDFDFYILLKKLNEPIFGSHEIQEKPTKVSTGNNTDGISVMSTEITHYSGTPNAFMLELFAINSSYDERYGFDILEAAYEMFPDRDYCILSLPTNHPPFPLLEHFTLVTSVNINRRFSNESLYVAHINSIRGRIRVRQGEQYDLKHLTSFLSRSLQQQRILELFKESLYQTESSTKIISYVLLSENQPIGVIIVGPQENAELQRAQFDIPPESLRIGTDGIILASSISPIFEPHFRWFLREILRQSKYTSLFWSFQTVSVPLGNQLSKLTSLSNQMVPMQRFSPLANITGFNYLDMFSTKGFEPVTYWHIDRPLTSLPKVDINNSIVVIGCSATGISFIETLILGPSSRYLNFSNVTLVSEYGYSAFFETSNTAVNCVPRYNRYIHSAMKQIPVSFYVNTVIGVMVKINRKKKYIILKSGHIVNYDILVLTCGVQFQHPEYLKESLETEMGKEQCQYRAMDNPKYVPGYVPIPPELPLNVMIVNGVHNAHVCLKSLMTMIEDSKMTRRCLSPKNVIIVYGDCLNVYSCMAALLELKINPQHIAFVEPPNEDVSPRVNCFNDEKIDQRVQASIEKLGIQVYRDYTIEKWAMRSNRLKKVTLISAYNLFEIDCFALFYFGQKNIDINTFKALNESDIVYDGGLVIGADFETNDPHIYAAGTCTRYSRRYYADNNSHRHYYSEDVGKALANRFLLKLDPFILMKDKTYCSTVMLPGFSRSLLRWEPLPKFESPVYVYAVLPGPLYYLKLRKPGPEIPMEVELSLPNQGHNLETDNEENLFRMKFNALHIFEGATCLCKSKFNPDFYINLYGKHESFFNHLFMKHEMNTIKDLNEHVSQPWIAPLYRCTFTDLLKDIYKQDVGTIYQVARAHSISDIPASSSDPELASAPCPIPLLKFENAFPLGNVPSIIKDYVSHFYFNQFFLHNSQIRDLPSECGQSVAVRAETAAYWKTIAGNRIVMSHLSKYLHENAVSNPQFAKTLPELTYMCHL